MKKILVLSILFFAMAVSVCADDGVTRFAFVSSEQSVSVGQLSDKLTVQSQSVPGTAANIGETFDMTFTSSSATGLFYSNASGTPVTKVTMAKNSANKNFYYSDISTGDFTLTVQAVGRDSKRSFETSQIIHIGAGDSPAKSASTDTGSPVGYTTTSAHSSPEPLSESLPNSFEISAGRDRLVTVGNSVLFKAVPQNVRGVPVWNLGYKWSFGDGTLGQGQSSRHVYKFPGEYTVVVTATWSDFSAVSRLSVKVVNPKVSLSRIFGGIEITNKNNSEINLEGWEIKSGGKSFYFPEDMIIGSGKTVTVPDESTGLNGALAELRSPAGLIYASDSLVEVASSTLLTQETKLTINPVTASSSANVATTNKTPISVVTPTKIVNTIKIKPRTQTATVVASATSAPKVFSAPDKKGFVSRAFAWPIAGFEFLRHLFVED